MECHAVAQRSRVMTMSLGTGHLCRRSLATTSSTQPPALCARLRSALVAAAGRRKKQQAQALRAAPHLPQERRARGVCVASAVIPEGLLSHESDDDDSSPPANATREVAPAPSSSSASSSSRGMPEGLLSWDADTLTLRVTPVGGAKGGLAEGLLSREDDSHGTAPAKGGVPEGMLSREGEGEVVPASGRGSTSTQQGAGRMLEGMLSIDDDAEGAGTVQAAAAKQRKAQGVPEGMLSVDDDAEGGVPSVAVSSGGSATEQQGAAQDDAWEEEANTVAKRRPAKAAFPEGMLSVEYDDDEGSSSSSSGSSSGSSDEEQQEQPKPSIPPGAACTLGPRATPEGMLSIDEASDDDESSGGDHDGDGGKGAGGGGARAPPSRALHASARRPLQQVRGAGSAGARSPMMALHGAHMHGINAASSLNGGHGIRRAAAVRSADDSRAGYPSAAEPGLASGAAPARPTDPQLDAAYDGYEGYDPHGEALMVAALERQQRALARVQGRLDALNASSAAMGDAPPGPAREEFEREVAAVKQLLSELQQLSLDPAMGAVGAASPGLSGGLSGGVSLGDGSADGGGAASAMGWLPNAEQLEADAERAVQQAASQLAAARRSATTALTEEGEEGMRGAAGGEGAYDNGSGSFDGFRAASGRSAATQAASQETDSAFNWVAQWYAVSPVETLDPSRPHPFTLLGKELVLWRDDKGQWRAFADACPHRLAPLSEGRVERDGSLSCAYHMWRWDGTGRCTSIPQARDAAAHDLAIKSERACATAYPTQVAQGLLWVWGQPTSAPGAAAAAAAQPPSVVSELDQLLEGGSAVATPWNFRDLPYGADYFLENVMDASHVPVAHHRIAGDRNKDIVAVQYEQREPVTPQGGFVMRSLKSWLKDVQHTDVHFVPPGHARVVQQKKDGSRTILQLYTTPTRPGWCRGVGRQVSVKGPKGNFTQGIAGGSFITMPVPAWLSHIAQIVFLQQDLVFLHGQQVNASRMQGRATQRYFMPTAADKTVIAFRAWFETFAGGAIPFAGAAPGSPAAAAAAAQQQQQQQGAGAGAGAGAAPQRAPPSVLFDTYHSHTASCAVCQRALRNLRAARAISAFLAAASVLAAAVMHGVAASVRAYATVLTSSGGGDLAGAVMMGPGGASHASGALALAALAAPPPVAALVALAAALAGAGLAVACGKLIDMLHVYSYHHADNP